MRSPKEEGTCRSCEGHCQDPGPSPFTPPLGLVGPVGTTVGLFLGVSYLGSRVRRNSIVVSLPSFSCVWFLDSTLST